MLSKEEIEKPVTVSSAQGLLRFSIAYHRVPAFVPLLAIHWCCFFQLGEDSHLLVFRSLFLFSLLFLEIIIYSWKLSFILGIYPGFLVIFVVILEGLWMRAPLKHLC